MAADFVLNVKPREEHGKGASRRARRAGRVPAVMYGHGIDPVHMTIDAHDIMMAMKVPNALLEIKNDEDGFKSLAVAREVQRHPVRREIVHVDLIKVKKGEKIEVDVPITIEGESAPETIVALEATTVRVLADATDLPEELVVSVEGREAGDHIYAGDVKLAGGIELVDDEELMVVNVSQEMSAEELEAELESDAQPDEPEEAGDDAEEAGDEAEEESED